MSTQCKTLIKRADSFFHFKVNIFVNLPFSPFCCFYYVFPLFLSKRTTTKKYSLPLSAVFYKCGRKTHSEHPLSATCSLGIRCRSDEAPSSLLNVICMCAVWSFTHACLRKVQLCCYTKGKLVWGQSQGHIIFRCLIFNTAHEVLFYIFTIVA